MPGIKALIRKSLPRSIIDTVRDIRYTRPVDSKYKSYIEIVEGGDGIEIGGPTWVFKFEIPIYTNAHSIDGVNFSGFTVWEGDISRNDKYYYHKNKHGKQFISEATDLSLIQSDKYDFLISSHCLEHIANPIKALAEWKRVVRPGGRLIVFVPDKQYFFDHRRDTTTFKHVFDDYSSDRDEHDLTHLEESLAKHDLSMDKWSGDFENLKRQFSDNFRTRCLHHHVFDLPVLEEMFAFVNLKLIRSEALCPNFAIVGEVPR